MKRNTQLAILITSGSVLAAGSGVLGAQALTGSSKQAPEITTTITLTNGQDGENGATGPAGPAGPPGADGTPGAEGCPTGSTFGELVINHPGGHTTIWTCLKNGA